MITCVKCGYQTPDPNQLRFGCPVCTIPSSSKGNIFSRLTGQSEFVTTSIERQVHVAYAEKIIRDHQRRKQA